MVLLLAVHENGRIYIYIYIRDECVGEREGGEEGDEDEDEEVK